MILRPAPAGQDDVLIALLGWLRQSGYAFVTTTPESHRRVLERVAHAPARDVRDVLGWSRPFAPNVLPAEVLALADEAGALEEEGGLVRARVRVSSLGDDLFLHSAYPTSDPDAVFFGPDSYRFAALIEAELRRRSAPVRTVVDIGTGAGAGAIVAARAQPGAAIAGTDINAAALRFARINAAAAGVALTTVESATLRSIPDPIDVVLANPPYILDDGNRDYRDGGGMHGAEVTLDMTGEALPRLAAGGTFILYTGAVIVEGRDDLQARLATLARAHGCSLRYREIDPDVFGEELSNPAYKDADRIAVVAAVFDRPLD